MYNNLHSAGTYIIPVFSWEYVRLCCLIVLVNSTAEVNCQLKQKKGLFYKVSVLIMHTNCD